MPCCGPPRTGPVSLGEVHVRAGNARHVITGFTLTHPALADLWQQVDNSISDVPVLSAEITRLNRELAATRLSRANLAAAGRATLIAWQGSEPDPMSYLRDELTVQGFAERLA